MFCGNETEHNYLFSLCCLSLPGEDGDNVSEASAPPTPAVPPKTRSKKTSIKQKVMLRTNDDDIDKMKVGVGGVRRTWYTKDRYMKTCRNKFIKIIMQRNLRMHFLDSEVFRKCFQFCD